MSIAINYKNTSKKINSSNIVLFVDEKFNIYSLKKYILSSEFSFISDLLKTKDLSKKIINFDKIRKFNGFSYFCPKLLKNLWFSDVFLYYWMWNTTADQIRIELKQFVFVCRKHHQSIRSALLFITLIVPESSMIKLILKICETVGLLGGC